jgi:hypothetical protein
VALVLEGDETQRFDAPVRRVGGDRVHLPGRDRLVEERGVHGAPLAERETVGGLDRPPLLPLEELVVAREREIPGVAGEVAEAAQAEAGGRVARTAKQ